MPTESEVDEPSDPVEEIPSKDILYMRIYKTYLREGDLIPGTFKNHGEGMSTDWSKYSTPIETQKRVELHKKNPNNYGVISMNVGKVRQVDKQTVEHRPVIDNRGHTEVIGEKTTEARYHFLSIIKWEIALENKS